MGVVHVRVGVERVHVGVEHVRTGVEGGGIDRCTRGVERVRAVSRVGASRAYARVLNAYAWCRGWGYRGRRRGCRKCTHVLRVYAGIEGVGKCEDNV